MKSQLIATHAISSLLVIAALCGSATATTLPPLRDDDATAKKAMLVMPPPDVTRSERDYFQAQPTAGMRERMACKVSVSPMHLVSLSDTCH